MILWILCGLTLRLPSDATEQGHIAKVTPHQDKAKPNFLTHLNAGIWLFEHYILICYPFISPWSLGGGFRIKYAANVCPFVCDGGTIIENWAIK